MTGISGEYNDRERLRHHIDRFSGTRIFVIGDIILDEYVWGDVSRISPEAPVPVVEVKRESTMLGGAANVIHNMAALGASPVLCGVIGEDGTGREIVHKVREMGLDISGIVAESGRKTSIKTRVVARNQQIVRFDRESREYIRPESLDRIMSLIQDNIPAIDRIVVSDYGKGVVSEALMKRLAEVAREFSVKIAVDPKIKNFAYYHDVDVITPNHHEAGAFCHFTIVDDTSLRRAGQLMLETLNCESVLITQGKEGMTLFEKNGEITHIPTLAKQVFDVTGAGDTVISTFALALASGLDRKSSARLSNLAAGIVVGKLGTSTVRAEDLKMAV